MNHSTLEPLSYSVPLKNYNNFPEEWMGQRSHRFTRTIRFDPPKDLIKTNFDLPDQTPKRGRSHFNQPSSFQKPFKPSLHKIPPIKHWHLRQSKIRTMDFQPTEPHRRPQRLHNLQILHNPEQKRNQSLRTFYLNNSRTQREYSIEERMQRKVRIDQAELRKTFFKDLNLFKK